MMTMMRMRMTIRVNDYDDDDGVDDDDDDDDDDAKGVGLPQHVNLLCSATSPGKLTPGKNHQRLIFMKQLSD